MGGYKKELEREFTFHQVIAKDDHSETVKLLREQLVNQAEYQRRAEEWLKKQEV
tara:strand:+ start:889 stop:1050 length:162 start_codon:yes stop_codon:yes gene_type:complete